MPRRVVVFDLGNVLIPWDRRRLYRTLISDPGELDHFCEHVLTMEENAKLDRGMPLSDMVTDLAARHPRYRDLIEAYATRWEETLGPVIEASVQVLREIVESGRRCLALSNWGADTFALVEERYEFMRWFDALVISGREGVVKPDPEIFAILCRRHDVDPTGAVFVDDSPANIDAARSLGFDTVRFEDPAQLRCELVSRCILPR